MLKATHLIYAVLALIGVFAIASLSGPSQAASEPLGTVIVGCDAERLEQPCAASTVAMLADRQIRDLRLRPRADGTMLHTAGG